MIAGHPALDTSSFSAAGLPAREVAQWGAARPSFTEPGKASQ